MRTVPLARRNLFQDRRRAALAVGGVSVALLLVFVLQGIFDGAMRQVTAYLRGLPADVVVSQKGVKTMHMSASALPESTVQRVGAVEGVARVDAIRFTTQTVRAHGRSQLSYVIGYATETGRGGPEHMVKGRAPRSGEVVLDQVAADELGVTVGSTVDTLGRRSVVSGLSSGGTNMANTTTFIPTGDFADIRGSAVSYIIVKAQPGVDSDTLTLRIAEEVPGTTAQTRAGIVQQEGNIVRDMSADVMQIMTVIGFLIALAIVALTLFTATLAKLREYAVVKAIGATPTRLTRMVLIQAVWTAGLALAVAVVLTFSVQWLVATVTPNVRIAIEPSAVVRAGIAMLLAAVLGALVPVRRLLKLDPMTVFRG
jgi:putative ABC transport system permease protein